MGVDALSTQIGNCTVHSLSRLHHWDYLAQIASVLPDPEEVKSGCNIFKRSVLPFFSIV